MEVAVKWGLTDTSNPLQTDCYLYCNMIHTYRWQNGGMVEWWNGGMAERREPRVISMVRYDNSTPR